MGGFELKIWRTGMNWSQERAAEELGVSRRTYISWEDKGCTKLVELATKALILREAWPDVAKQLKAVSTIARH